MGLSAALILSLFTAVLFGNADLSFQDVYRVIGYEVFHYREPVCLRPGSCPRCSLADPSARVLMAAAVGTGLSVCGVVMQAVVKNPLADPYVLGVSSGAYLGAAASILLGIGSVLGDQVWGLWPFRGSGSVLWCAFYFRHRRTHERGETDSAGMAVSTVCSAFANF